MLPVMTVIDEPAFETSAPRKTIGSFDKSPRGRPPRLRGMGPCSDWTALGPPKSQAVSGVSVQTKGAESTVRRRGAASRPVLQSGDERILRERTCA